MTGRPAATMAGDFAAVIALIFIASIIVDAPALLGAVLSYF